MFNSKGFRIVSFDLRMVLNLCALSIAFVFTSLSFSYASCSDNQIDLRGDWGQIRFKVELAATPEARSKGLMYREFLPQSSGMLFFYEKPSPVSFWMKDTFIPLDMLFIDVIGIIKKVHQKSIPLSTELILGGDDILAVLEINAGLSELYGIGPDTIIRHPRIPQANAAWPCK